MARTGNAFTTDFDCKTVGNTGYILTVISDSKEDLYYLLEFLNSRILLYCLNQITSRFDENGWRWLRQFVEQLRIPKFINKDVIVSIVSETNRYNQPGNSEIINTYVAKIFGLSEEELSYINRSLDGY